MNTQPASTADTTGSWVVAAVATAVLAVVLGVFGSIGVLIDPLADAYAAPRAQVALLFAAALAVHSLAARRAGRVLDRWGPRPLLVVAAAGIAVGPLAPATASTVGLAVAGYGVGVGLASACTWVATTGVVSATFHRRRSAALGLLTAGPAAGGVVLAPVMAALADTIGPRPTCVAVAALGVTACVTGAVLLGGHRAPAQPTSGTGTGAANAATADSPEPGSRGFLLAGLLMSLVVFIPLVHITASATRLGLSPGHGAAVLAVISATSAATRLARRMAGHPDHTAVALPRHPPAGRGRVRGLGAHRTGRRSRRCPCCCSSRSCSGPATAAGCPWAPRSWRRPAHRPGSATPSATSPPSSASAASSDPSLPAPCSRPPPPRSSSDARRPRSPQPQPQP